MQIKFIKSLLMSTARPISIGPLVFAFCIGNAVVFQWPLYRMAALSLSDFSFHGTLAILTLFVLQFLVSFTLLGTIAIISVRLFRLVSSLLCLGNAAALYFVVKYNVILDSTMMGNILHTNFKEAGELAHPQLLVYVLLLGILPAIVLLRMRILPTPRARQAVNVLAVLVLGLSWLYFNAASWLWIDQNAKRFGGLVLPWSYTFNTVRFLRQQADQNRPPVLLPSAHALDDKGGIVVLVIGESARAQNFSLYGYTRETNHLISQTGLITLPAARACATYTTAALRCMLSYRGADGALGNDEPLPSYLFRHGVEVIWRTNNFGEPPLHVTAYETADNLRKRCASNCARTAYDEVLLQGLGKQLSSSSKTTKTLIVLHQAGSHGPRYFSKYPNEMERYKPACRSVEVQKCTPAELINAYDNTIAYNDYFLDRLIAILKAEHGRPSVMMYMSDHGESLGEHGLYLHGVPLSLAPDVQTNVPLLVWMSPDFSAARGPTSATSATQQEFSQGVVFHSVMGAFGMTSSVYRADLDIFRPIKAGTPGQNREVKK